MDDAVRQAQVEALRDEIKHCRRCAEAGFFVGAPVSANPVSARIMLIGQAPSEAGATYNRQFAWRPGRPRPRVWDWFAEVGWTEEEFRALAYISPVTKCYPGRAKSGSGDRQPTATEVKLCAGYLDRELALIDPDLIITVGTLALKRLTPGLRLDEVVGQVLKASIAGRERFLVPLPHPSGVSRWLNEAPNQAKLKLALETLRRVKNELFGADSKDTA